MYSRQLRIANIADGVIVGSVLIAKMAEVAQNEDSIYHVASFFIKELRQAIDSIG